MSCRTSIIALAIWLLLMGITIISWWLGHGHDFAKFAPVSLTTAILALTFFKIRLVIIHFMEIGHAPAALRAPFELWCVSVCGMLIYAFARITGSV